MNDKTIITPEPKEEESTIFLLRSISNRLAKVEGKITAMEDDKKQYREEREKKEESTLDIIKKEIQEAANTRELKTWSVIKDRALYVGIALLIAWLLQFIK